MRHAEAEAELRCAQMTVEGVSERHAEAEAELRCAQAELAQREEQLAEHGAHIEFQTVDRLAQ